MGNDLLVFYNPFIFGAGPAQKYNWFQGIGESDLCFGVLKSRNDKDKETGKMSTEERKWLYTLDEIVALMGKTSIHSVRRWIHDKQLPASFIGGKYYVQIWDLYDFLNAHKELRCHAGPKANGKDKSK